MNFFLGSVSYQYGFCRKSTFWFIIILQVITIFSLSGFANADNSSPFTSVPINPEWTSYNNNQLFNNQTPYGGVMPLPFDTSQISAREIGVTKAEDLPSSFDLRTIGQVTSVKDQKPFGTCWAFGALGSLESYLLPTDNHDFSEKIW
jgi:C1A family cysteine protease